MSKKTEQRKVSKKKRSIQRYKWLKVIFAELDDIKKRIKRIEELLGLDNEDFSSN